MTQLRHRTSSRRALLGTDALRAAGPGRPDLQVIGLTLLVVPLAYAGLEIGPFQVSGFLWVSVLAFGLVTLLARAPDPTAVRYATPILAYVLLMVISLAWTPDVVKGAQTAAQWATPVVVYLVAMRAFRRGLRLEDLSRLAVTITVPVVLFVYWRGLAGGSSVWWLSGEGARPFAMSMVLLFAMGSLGRSRRFAMVFGLIALGLVAVSGGRMGTLVMAAVLLATPAFQIRWHVRVLTGAMALVAVAALVVPTQTFQDRWFFNEEGDVTDILSGQFNTAGREQNWPAVLARCDNRPLLGHGSGASTAITASVTDGKTNHPHNEYIRTYCDGGLIGSVLFWTFFGSIIFRAAAGMRINAASATAGTALAVALALLLFSITDNITVYTPIFMAPAAIVFAASDALYADRRIRRRSYARGGAGATRPRRTTW